ncbi:hypothetical protein L1049_020807 [Liquidambar formosana]|uniref:AAA+ ATPase domain-containing protein n=1 Tax=Liquidambar formosana TaxID=63359 RepID=A0AAP0S9N2_LIQFO
MAVDIVISIAAKIGEYLVAPIGRRLGYLLCYKCNTEDFRKKVENLKTEGAAVQLRVEAAERNGEVIFPNVQVWLTRVNKITEVFDEVQANKRFHIGVSWPAPPVFEARKLIFEKIMEALKDDQINMIGICGMGGVGKTTLVKEVAKQAEDHKDQFDEVVMAVVSQTPNFIKIQDEIADKLGLKFDVNSESGRARKLFARLTQKKRILVILDDIWERVELEAIGIPSGANHKGCKIVLISRKKDVCYQMGIKEPFSINILSEQEAWTLFSKMAGDSVYSPLPRPTAVEVAKECGGLPLAIAVVARALRNKDLSFWLDALNRLRKSIQENEVSLALELSYTHLESEEAKNFFLLCSLFPEDDDIAIEDLLKYGIEGHREEYVRIHDVVRDVAISIASKENRAFLVKAGWGLKEWPKEDTYEPYTAISIMSNDIHELPDGLECPNLQILFLDGNRPSFQFPENFFLGMENLKVLKMSGIHFLSLPPSLRYLKNLRTLCLDGCSLKDISIVRELKKLQVLSVSNSDIKELPKEMGMLTHLRLLDLRRCEQLAVIQPDVIANLSQLEGLYMSDKFDKWEIEGQQNQRSNASLVELNHLSRLTVLETHIPDANLLPEDSLFHNLSRFRISIGTRFEGYEEVPNCLSLKFHVSTPQKNGVNVLLKKAKHLQLREMKGLKSIIYGLDREGFPNLRRLDVRACHEVEYVFNATEGVSPGKLDSVVSSGQEVQEAEEEKEEGEKLNKMSKEAEKAEEEVEREENVSAQAIQQEISELVEEEA